MIRGPGRPFRPRPPTACTSAAAPGPAPRPLRGLCSVCVVARASAFAACAAGERNMTLYAPGSSFQRLPLQPSPLHRFISLAPAPRLHDPTTVPDPGPAERREE